MTTPYSPKEAAYFLLSWLDNNESSVRQALIMAAEHNEAAAADIEKTDPEQQAVITLLRQSGQSWRRHAAELTAIWERTPEGFDIDQIGLA